MKVVPRTKKSDVKQTISTRHEQHLKETDWELKLHPSLLLLMLPPLQWSAVEQHLSGEVLGHTVTLLIKYNASASLGISSTIREALL